MVGQHGPEFTADEAQEQVRLLKSVVAGLELELEFKNDFYKKPASRSEAVQVIRQYSDHPEVSDLLKSSTVPRSTYYYKRGESKWGRKPTLVISNIHGEVFDNRKVVESMETELQQEFSCYGYHNMCDVLQEAGWIINHKKVYRLVKMHHLLFNRKFGQAGIPRQFVRFRKIVASKPLEHLCMDIKYVHIHGAQKNALLLTVIDVYSRKVLIHMLKFNIRKGGVIVMLSLLLLEYKIKGMTIRNDNGSQLIATVVREYLKEKGVSQEFTHVATPEENAYIEALHSFIQREVIERIEFDSLYHAKMIFSCYYEWYNTVRKHGSLGRKTPESVLKENQIQLPYKTTNRLTLNT